MGKVLDNKVRVINPEAKMFGEVAHVESVNEPFYIVRFTRWSKEADGFVSFTSVYSEDELEDYQTRAQVEASRTASMERYGCN